MKEYDEIKIIIIITIVKNNPMVKLFYFIFFTSMYFVRFMNSEISNNSPRDISYVIFKFQNFKCSKGHQKINLLLMTCS